MSRKLKVLDLFSGIGGFALGLDSTGFFETVKFVEKDKYCQKVLRKNFPNIPIEEDIKNVKGKEYSADVVVGGFPCQPFSVAGKQKGTNDDRYLWPEMLRLIREIKPEFVIGENVQGIINIQNGMVLRQVQNDLESEGFEVQCFLIPASGIGAWHQRYRVWIVGHSNDNGLLREVHKAENVSNTEHIRLQNQSRRGLSKLESESKKEEKRKRDKSSFCTKTSSSERRGREEDVSNTNSKGLERHRKKYQLREIKQKKNIEWSSNGRGKETWWQAQSNLCGVPDGISYGLDKNRANRIKTLGNAIVPQIARELGLAIKKVMNEDTNI